MTKFGGFNVVYVEVNNDPRIDIGGSIGGAINIASSENGKVVTLMDNVEAGAAVGDAAAGALTVAVSNQNDVAIGDYDISDATQNEVISKVRGRGYAQGAEVNIGEQGRLGGAGRAPAGVGASGWARGPACTAFPHGSGARRAGLWAEAGLAAMQGLAAAGWPSHRTQLLAAPT